MDLKLIDFFRCPPVIMFDALVAKRMNLSSLLYIKSATLNGCFSYLGIFVSALLFMCQQDWLVEFYRFIAGVILLISSFLLQTTLRTSSSETPSIQNPFFELISQSTFATSIGLPVIQFTWFQKLLLTSIGQLLLYRIFIWKCVYHRPVSKRYAQWGYILSMATTVAVMFTKNDLIFTVCVNITLLPQFFQLYYTVSRFFRGSKFHILVTWQTIKMEVNENGVLAVLETLWNRLRVPHVLRLFFFFRVVFISALLFYAYPLEHEIDKEYHPEGMYYYLSSLFPWTTTRNQRTNKTMETNITYYANFMQYVYKDHMCPLIPPYTTTPNNLDSFQSLIVKLTDSLISIFSISSVMYVPLYYFGVVVHIVVGGIDIAQAASLSIVSATLFCLLSIQTGLSGLPPHKRLVRLVRNMWLLFAAILHFIHDLVNPVLLQISAQVNIPIRTHIRPLTVLFVLFWIPILLCLWLMKNEPLSTWMVAVVAFCVELVFKVISTFMLYLLFAIDARIEHRPWPHMDDYVFTIQSTAHIIEFICGCIMFFNGAYVFLFESGNLLRALMMTMHAYINIYKAACDGWKTFNNRRTVNKRISKLELATEEQLNQNEDDVCSICYQEFTTEFGETKSTDCNHLFHSSCLRRWLFIRETCPMCHQTI